MSSSASRTERPSPASSSRPLVTGGARPDLAADRPAVEIRRSARRRRTVSAYRDGDGIVVLVPARLSRSDEARLVEELVDKIMARERNGQRRGVRSGDADLQRRATALSREYLGGRATPTSVRWVTNMEHRWGSATPSEGTIRLSHRLQAMPDWVIDYVLMHELSHLLESGHGPEFWALTNRYPRTERARGYLEGYAIAAQLPPWEPSESGESSGSTEASDSPASADSGALF